MIFYTRIQKIVYFRLLWFHIFSKNYEARRKTFFTSKNMPRRHLHHDHNSLYTIQDCYNPTMPFLFLCSQGHPTTPVHILVQNERRRNDWENWKRFIWCKDSFTLIAYYIWYAALLSTCIKAWSTEAKYYEWPRFKLVHVIHGFF